MKEKVFHDDNCDDDDEEKKKEGICFTALP